MARVSEKSKAVERPWREEGLQLPARHNKRKCLYRHDACVIRLRPKYPNPIGAIDCVHDKLSNGRPYKMLTVPDESTREALCVSVATKMGSADCPGSALSAASQAWQA